MKRVKLIKDVVIEEVLCDNLNSIECRFFNPATMSVVHETNEALATKSVERYVVPIKSWLSYKCCGKAPVQGLCLAEGCPEGYCKEEDYIAISPMIDETLGKYIKVLIKEKEAVEDSRDYEKRRKEENYSELLESRKEVGRLKGRLYDINNTSFWKRLKYLFTGRLD